MTAVNKSARPALSVRAAICLSPARKPVTSLGEAISKLDQELFVGRKPELAAFREWLDGDAGLPEVLNVSGPSGVGKSALLRTFKRIALEGGRALVLASAGTFPASPSGLLSALQGSGTGDLRGVVARLNKTRSLILLDAFDELGGLTDYLQCEFLPLLETSVRVVIAGRYPLSLAWSRNEIWHKLIRPLRLEGFSPTESREYLRRRGLSEPALVDHVITAAGNNPLALSLASDLALRFGVRDFAGAPEWRLIVRSLVERLLVEVRDPELRALLEASVAVRQFDEATLAAISGREDISAAFSQLCQLSIVSPADHGLMLHDDVRRRLTADLAWRHPDRHNALRARAVAYYSERVRSAPPCEREWLVADRFYLWSNPIIQELFFGSDEPGQVSVQPGGPADRANVRRLFSQRMATPIGPDDLAPLSVRTEDGDFLEALLMYAGTRLRIARDRDGHALGFSTVLPVCRETIPLLDLHPAYAPLVHAYWNPVDLSALPASPERTTIFYWLHLVSACEMSGTIRAALLRDLSRVFSSGGVYLCSTPVSAYKRMLEACGYERLPAARNQAWGADYPVDGYVLDLSRIGVEHWIEAVMNGRQPPKPLDRAELENELRGAFRHWTDDGWLAHSRLAELPAVLAMETEGQRPGAVRETILETLATARPQASVGLDAAYRAVEFVYLSRRRGQKVGAKPLAVSRATLYRLAKQGIRGLAEALSQPAR